MAYSTFQKEEQEGLKYLDLIMESSELKLIPVVLKELFSSLFIGIKKTAGDLFYGQPIASQPEISVIEGLNSSFPDSRLEEICVDVAKDLEASEKNLKVNYAGLVYHLFLDIVDGSFDQKGSYFGEFPSDKALLDPDYYENNHAENYYLDEGCLFTLVKMYAPDSTVDEGNLKDLVPINHFFKINDKSHLGGLISLRVEGRSPGGLDLYLCQAGKEVHNSLFRLSPIFSFGSEHVYQHRQFTTENDPTFSLPTDFSTQKLLVMSPHLKDLREKIDRHYHFQPKLNSRTKDR